ncbi:hypothetical protein [Micromonospora sp. NPDC048843]|uniref:hypothetical protein n=1 Tax=Micromonospora sp. NPDC048843 TaxID=3155389 RepID=UPI0033D901F7
MSREDFEEAVLDGVRLRLDEAPFIVREVTVTDTTLARDGDATDLVVLLAIRSDTGVDQFGWRSRIWPGNGLPAEAASQNLVSSLVERVEAGKAVLDGPERDGVRWLGTMLDG